MQKLFQALDVDYDQWRALTIVALKVDLRVTAVGGAAFQHQGANRGLALFGLAAFYLMTGAFASILVFVIRDVMLSGTLVLTYLMFMVGAMVLLDNHSIITSPDDYPVLGFRPISSRTYFAARLTNVLAYTVALTTAFGVIPMAAFTFVRGFNPALGLAAILAFYLSTTFATLVLVLAYAGLLRAIGADRLKRALSYLQLVMGFVMYGGYFLMTSMFDRTTMAAMTLPDTPWVFLYPATWFASYLALADGRAGVVLVLSAAGSIVALVSAAAGLGGRLSLRYAEEMGALVSATAAARPRSARARRPLWFTGGETRAIALLVRAQFRNDQKFRMGVLGILPLTILYIVMSLRNGPLPDPFAHDWERASDMFLITLAVLAFPTSLRLNLTRSDAFRASWIYYTAPVERSRLVRATTKILVAFFLLPYLTMVAVALGYFTRQPVHVFVHVVFLGLLSHLMLQTVMLVDPELPFSQPMQKGVRSGFMFVTMMVAAFASLAVAPLLAMFVYVSPMRIAGAMALLAGSSLALDWLTRVRVKRLAAGLEFVA